MLVEPTENVTHFIRQSIAYISRDNQTRSYMGSFAESATVVESSVLSAFHGLDRNRLNTDSFTDYIAIVGQLVLWNPLRPRSAEHI